MKRALALVALGACRHNEPPKPDLIVIPSASFVATTPAPVVVDAAPPPPAMGSRERVGAPGSTKGTVSCGRVRCKGDEELCLLDRDSLWSCVAAKDALGSSAQFQCDDASDCKTPGYVCATDNPGYAACTVMKGVDSDPMGYEVCNTDQDAPACPKGQSCVDGICRPPPPRATCTGKKACPADTPVCVWENGVGHCRGPVDAGITSTYECTRPSDCGAGFTCCTEQGFDDSLPPTQCRAGCGIGLEVVCEKTAECPPFFATGANSGLVPRSCKKRRASPDYPVWSGKCGF